MALGVLAPAAIGLGTTIVGNKLFGGSKKPKIDYAGMLKTVREGAGKQREYVNTAYSDVKPLDTKFSSDMGTLGTNYESKVSGLGEDYLKSLQGMTAGDQELATKQLDLAKEQAYRTLPVNQEIIRKNLAASGNLRTGASAKAFGDTVLQNQQNLSDYGQKLGIANLQANQARMETGITNVYNSKAGAALQRLGLDADTFRTLYQNGRTDILDQAMKLVGISDQEVANILGVQGIQANAELVSTFGENANRQALLNSITSIVGQAGAQWNTNKNN